MLDWHNGEVYMPTYPIFTDENGQRIALNPVSVVSVSETSPGRVSINLPEGGMVRVQMSLEGVVEQLSAALRSMAGYVDARQRPPNSLRLWSRAVSRSSEMKATK
jgi:hypothetical protein